MHMRGVGGTDFVACVSGWEKAVEKEAPLHVVQVQRAGPMRDEHIRSPSSNEEATKQ